jgi:hypothetical protein
MSKQQTKQTTSSKHQTLLLRPPRATLTLSGTNSCPVTWALVTCWRPSPACMVPANFLLGSLMDAAMPASAATSARFVLAGLALSPFLTSLKKELMGTSLLAGCFTAMGYVSQSVALVDTSRLQSSFWGPSLSFGVPFSNI